MSITTMSNHSWNPTHLPPYQKGEVRPSKNWGGQNFLQERGDKLEKGFDVEMGGLPLFYYFTVQFSPIYCVHGESKVPLYYFLDLQSFGLAMQDFHSRSHSSLLLKPGIICTFLIHSGSLKKMLTALFRNTQKSIWTIFLSAKAKCFLVLKRF